MLRSLHHADYQKLRDSLKSMRMKAGVTQVQMADALGVGQSFVSKIERGESYVDFFLYVQWCRTCDTSATQTLKQLLATLE